MRRLTICLIAASWSLAVVAAAHEHDKDLPEGPIRTRHELMEGVGKNAKIIGDAMKAGDFAKIPVPANAIAEAAKRVPYLFPEGSEHPKSRAKPEIWKNPEAFALEAQKLETTAAALAKAAGEQKNVPQAAKEMFGACKSCHDKYRIPED